MFVPFERNGSYIIPDVITGSPIQSQIKNIFIDLINIHAEIAKLEGKLT